MLIDLKIRNNYKDFIKSSEIATVKDSIVKLLNEWQIKYNLVFDGRYFEYLLAGNVFENVNVEKIFLVEEMLVPEHIVPYISALYDVESDKYIMTAYKCSNFDLSDELRMKSKMVLVSIYKY